MSKKHSPLFASEERVPVTVDGNTIYIRAAMDVVTYNKVLAAAGVLLQKEQAGQAVNVGNYMLALLIFNILGWEGPAFKGIPCTPLNIGKLDSNSKLYDAVVDEIARRNPAKPKQKEGLAWLQKR